MNARKSRTSTEILAEALTHLETAQRHAANDLDQQVVIDAICMRLSAGIEALARLDDTTREALFGDDWKLMWGMRNRIAHGYLLVEATIVSETMQRDVPAIVKRIRAAGDTA